MNKLLEFIKSNLLGFIIGVVFTATTCVSAAILVSSSDVSLSSTKTDKTNVQEALNELYDKVNTCETEVRIEEPSVLFLGKGTSFNLSTISSSINPADYTLDNFVIGLDSMPNTQCGYKSENKYLVSSSYITAMTLTKSYTSNVLTIGGNTITNHTCVDSSPKYCSDARSTVTGTPFAYLSKKTIKNYNDEIAAGNKIEKNQLYYLGDGTSFDLSSYSKYGDLRTTNFLIGITATSRVEASKTWPYNDPYYASASTYSGFNITRSYDETTGILTVSGASHTVTTCIAAVIKYCTDSSGTETPPVHVYFIDGYNFSA